jgi:hypothetical protein
MLTSVWWGTKRFHSQCYHYVFSRNVLYWPIFEHMYILKTSKTYSLWHDLNVCKFKQSKLLIDQVLYGFVHNAITMYNVFNRNVLYWPIFEHMKIFKTSKTTSLWHDKWFKCLQV